jgi:hypothetical protein
MQCTNNKMLCRVYIFKEYRLHYSYLKKNLNFRPSKNKAGKAVPLQVSNGPEGSRKLSCRMVCRGNKVKDKAVPWQTWSGPEGSRNLSHRLVCRGTKVKDKAVPLKAWSGPESYRKLSHRLVCRGTKVKDKVVPLQTSTGPEGSRNLRLPDFLTTAQGGGKVVSRTHRPHLPPGEEPGTHSR